MSQTSQGWNKMNKKRIYEKPLIYQTHTHMYVSTIQPHIIVASFVIGILPNVFVFFYSFGANEKDEKKRWDFFLRT